jgi:hypothetical protein
MCQARSGRLIQPRERAMMKHASVMREPGEHLTIRRGRPRVMISVLESGHGAPRDGAGASPKSRARNLARRLNLIAPVQRAEIRLLNPPESGIETRRGGMVKVAGMRWLLCSRRDRPMLRAAEASQRTATMMAARGKAGRRQTAAVVSPEAGSAVAASKMDAGAMASSKVAATSVAASHVPTPVPAAAMAMRKTGNRQCTENNDCDGKDQRSHGDSPQCPSRDKRTAAMTHRQCEQGR